MPLYKSIGFLFFFFGEKRIVFLRNRFLLWHFAFYLIDFLIRSDERLLSLQNHKLEISNRIGITESIIKIKAFVFAL